MSETYIYEWDRYIWVRQIYMSETDIYEWDRYMWVRQIFLSETDIYEWDRYIWVRQIYMSETHGILGWDKPLCVCHTSLCVYLAQEGMQLHTKCFFLQRCSALLWLFWRCRAPLQRCRALLWWYWALLRRYRALLWRCRALWTPFSMKLLIRR